MTVAKIEMPPGDKAQLLELFEPQGELFREVVLDLIPMLADRIHHKGLAADGTPIGTYSDAYMKTRTGSFTNTQKISKGPNKGKNKGAGTVTKGAAKGSARPKYNRSSDTSVIISLTRQLENDYAVKPGDIGWGVGFTNAHNFDKATWNNQRYGYRIYGSDTVKGLTDAEEKRVVELTEQLLQEKSGAIS